MMTPDKEKIFRTFFQPLVDYYGFPSRLKGKEERQSWADQYLEQLAKYKKVIWDDVRDHIQRHHDYFPKITQMQDAIKQFLPVSDPKQVYKKHMEAERARRRLRKTVREDIYRANTETCEKIIKNGWGLQFACALSDMFESSYSSGQYALLAKDANARVHYSPAVCQGKDPLYYYSCMSVNPNGRKAMEKNPVQFVMGVWS